MLSRCTKKQYDRIKSIAALLFDETILFYKQKAK